MLESKEMLDDHGKSFRKNDGNGIKMMKDLDANRGAFSIEPKRAAACRYLSKLHSGASEKLHSAYALCSLMSR